MNGKKKEYIRILNRFIKESRIEIKKQYISNDVRNFIKNATLNDLYKVFDLTLYWNTSSEGYKFWYFTELDLTYLFILFTKKKDKNIIQYYSKLLSGYNHQLYENETIWQSHKFRLNKIINI